MHRRVGPEAGVAGGRSAWRSPVAGTRRPAARAPPAGWIARKRGVRPQLHLPVRNKQRPNRNSPAAFRREHGGSTEWTVRLRSCNRQNGQSALRVRRPTPAPATSLSSRHVERIPRRESWRSRVSLAGPQCESHSAGRLFLTALQAADCTAPARLRPRHSMSRVHRQARNAAWQLRNQVPPRRPSPSGDSVGISQSARFL